MLTPSLNKATAITRTNEPQPEAANRRLVGVADEAPGRAGRSCHAGMLRRRIGLFAAAALSTVAVTGALSAPAFAATKAAVSSTVCRGISVTYRSAPFSGNMYGTLCNNGTGGSCPGGPNLATSIPGWASLFISITSVNGGCYRPTADTESMWVNIGVRVSDGLSTVDGTVWLRAAEAPDGTVSYQAGATPGDVFSEL
jgi:hypothetical protein